VQPATPPLRPQPPVTGGKVDITWVRGETAPDVSSGLAALRRVRDGLTSPIPLAALMSFRLVEAEPGRVAFEMAPDVQHANSLGVVHGGVPALALDQAVGDAVRTMLPDDVPYSTIDLFLTYVRPVSPGSGLRCEAWVTHLGRRTARVAGRVTTSGKTVCECLSTLWIDRSLG
jgi:uncharacterized protein (TIGR00369 family)